MACGTDRSIARLTYSKAKGQSQHRTLHGVGAAAGVEPVGLNSVDILIINTDSEMSWNN